MVADTGSLQHRASGPSARLCARWGLDPTMLTVLDLVSPYVDEATRHRVTVEIARGVDWEVLLQVSHRHRLTPLLHRGVSASWSDLVPQAVRNELRLYLRQNTLRNLMAVSDFCKVHALLEDAGIPVIAYKGPTLAQRLYGSPGLRLYGDLDILVPPEDVARALNTMADAGYVPAQDLDTYLSTAYIAAKREARMLAPGSGTLVEIQWRVAAHWEIPLAIDGLREMWGRTEIIELAGRTVRVLCREDLMVVLCAHAACHCFQWPSSVCDISELARQSPDLDWARVEQVAEHMHVRRMVHLAMLLCHALLGQPVPAGVNIPGRDRVILRRLGRLTCRALRGERGFSGSLWREARMHIGLRPNLSDKLRFARHYAVAYFTGRASGAKPDEDARP